MSRVAVASEFLGQRDDDARRASHLAEPVLVPVLNHIADEFGAVGAQAGHGFVDVIAREHDSEAQRVRRSHRGLGLDQMGLRNFVSSTRPWPSGVRIMAMSTWTPSSPLRRSPV